VCRRITHDRTRTHASTIALQWVTGANAVVFGGLMLLFGAIADRFGRRRIMLIGLVLLGVASLATAFVASAEQLIVVRAVMGIAAAMTTPGSLALASGCSRRTACASVRQRSSRPLVWSGSRSAQRREASCSRSLPCKSCCW
jgi:MFS family permease